MRVAGVQFRAASGSLAASRRRLVRLARSAAVDADLLVLPEMAATGYAFDSFAAAQAVAETPDGETFAVLSAVAAAAGCWLVAGFPERAGDRLFNSAMVIRPDGELAFVYRKTMLFDAELPWATPGDSGYRAFDTDAGRFGVGICMDLNDDGFLGWCRGAALDALAFPTNWVDEGDPDPWDYWASRLGAEPAALVAANTWGTHGALRFCGRSAVLRQRVILAALPKRGDGILRTDLAL